MATAHSSLSSEAALLNGGDPIITRLLYLITYLLIVQ